MLVSLVSRFALSVDGEGFVYLSPLKDHKESHTCSVHFLVYTAFIARQCVAFPGMRKNCFGLLFYVVKADALSEVYILVPLILET